MNSEVISSIQTGDAATEKKIHKVTFLPFNKTVEARAGMSILDIALENGIDLEHNCGGNCACSTCHVIVIQGMEYLTAKSFDEEDQLEDADGLTRSSRLGCQAKVLGDVVVEVRMQQ
jgi:2Fe-2S ferredoxin